MKKFLASLFVLLAFCGSLSTNSEAMRIADMPSDDVRQAPIIGSRISTDPRAAEWADSLMQHMSLKEKIGQLLVYKFAPQNTRHNRQFMQRVIRQYHIGGVLFSGGSLVSQAQLTNEAQRHSHIPLMVTLDGEWGLAMRLKPTPVFPRNRILGCITNDSLIYEYGREVARECREMGITVNFAPVADVDNNADNPVINVRSFGESRYNVASKVVAYARGLEAGGVVAVAKHFPGHGDTNVDSHKALPTLNFDRQRLDSIEMYPFRRAIAAGIDGIMVGHLDVPALSERNGLPSSLSQNIVTSLLEDELQFTGLKFTDALEMKGVSGNNSACLQALKAGNDLLLVPSRLKEEFEAIERAVKRGEVSEEFINAKCRKVLMYKYVLGLHTKPQIQISGLEQRINTPEAQQLIERLSVEAVTLLGNVGGAVPVDTDVKDVVLLNVGGKSSVIAPFVSELSTYAVPTVLNVDASTTAAARQNILSKLKDYKRIIVCLSDRKVSDYASLLAAIPTEAPIIYVSFVPAKEMMGAEEGLRHADAVLLAHDTLAAVQVHAANVIYGREQARGSLSTSLGTLYAVGDGFKAPVATSAEETAKEEAAEPVYRPEDYGFDTVRLAQIDSIALEGITKKAYPGCQIVVYKDGHEVISRTYGHHTYDADALPVSATDVYDLASLSKTTGTLLAVMKLFDETRLGISDYASRYLSYLQNTDKRTITISDLLFHESGLPATISFYREAIDDDSYRGKLFVAKRDRNHTVQIESKLWAPSNIKFKAGVTSPVSTSRHTLQICDSLWIDSSFVDSVYCDKIATARRGARRYVYSDINFILLQQAVEAITGMPLDEYLDQEFFKPMGLKRTTYLAARHLPKDEIVPTVDDAFLRHRLLQGYVHDEAAAFKGGVSGNAGLFSNAEEVARIYQMLLDGGVWQGQRYLSEATCRMFTTVTSKRSRRGLGFDKPATNANSSNPCADAAPRSVYGHTGFTGTCAWVDPDSHMVFVFLSNRVNPHPWINRLSSLNIRPRLQQALYDALDKR